MSKMWNRTCVSALALSAALLLSYQSKTLGHSSPKDSRKAAPCSN